MKLSAVLCSTLFVLATSAPLPFDGKVRYNKDGSYIAYMDPPFQSNHASFLEQFPDGGLGMAWFSGSSEGQSNVAIVYSSLASGSTQWSSPKVISQRTGYSNQNPVLFYDNTTDLLHCFHSQQQANSGKGESEAQIWHLQSSDLGETWTKSAPLFTAYGSFCKNRIVPNLKNGLLFPIYNASNNTAMIAISQTRNNLGDSKSWTINPIENSDHLVQPSLIRLPLSYPKIKAFFRDRKATAIYEATSTDDGETWETPYSFQLPNPNVAIQANVVKEGAIILLFNDYNGKNSLGRTPMTMGFSYDDATTFPNIRNLQYHNDNETSLNINGPHVEYSYPSVLQTPDGWIHVSYTYDRQTIKYMKFNYTWALVG
eukprot:323499_1